MAIFVTLSNPANPRIAEFGAGGHGRQGGRIGFRISSKRLSTLWTQRANRLLDKLFGFETFNAAFQAAPECPDSDLAQAILDTLGVRLELSGASKDVIPRDGALVVVCNHPFGNRRPGHRRGPTVDTIRRLRDRRALVGATPALAKLHIDCRGPPRASKSDDVKASQAGSQLSSGSNAAALSSSFPRGRRRASAGGACPSPISPGVRTWRASFEHFGRVPVYFEGRNSRIFYALTAIFPGLANFLLARECLRKSNAGVRAVIGQPIAPGELSKFHTDEEAVQFLRRKVEALARQGAAPA